MPIRTVLRVNLYTATPAASCLPGFTSCGFVLFFWEGGYFLLWQGSCPHSLSSRFIQHALHTRTSHIHAHTYAYAHTVAKAEACYEWTRTYIKERKAFGGALADLQTVRHNMAEMKTDIAVGRTFYDRCLELHHVRSPRRLVLARFLGGYLRLYLRLYLPCISVSARLYLLSFRQHPLQRTTPASRAPGTPFPCIFA